MGVLSASFILAMASITHGMRPEEATADSISTLGLGYAVILLTLWTLMLVSVSFYRISRDDHEKNLQALAKKRAEQV